MSWAEFAAYLSVALSLFGGMASLFLYFMFWR